MIDEILNKIDNCKNTVVFLPDFERDYLEMFDNMFPSSVIFFDNCLQEYSEVFNKINNSNIKKCYFVSFKDIYRKILPEINRKKIEVYSILLCDVCNLTNNYVLDMFSSVMEFYERKTIDKLFVLNNGMYEVLKHANYNIEKLELQLNNSQIDNKEFNSNSIGIISIDYDPVHNFYNMLSSMVLLEDYDKVKLVSHMNATTNFFKYFALKYELCDTLEEVIKDNFVNLYINFANTNPLMVFKSMNMGIPCLVGNTDIFDNNEYLKEHLVLKSDDDINEIADKIKFVKANRKKIIDTYFSDKNALK